MRLLLSAAMLGSEISPPTTPVAMACTKFSKGCTRVSSADVVCARSVALFKLVTAAAIAVLTLPLAAVKLAEVVMSASLMEMADWRARIADAALHRATSVSDCRAALKSMVTGLAGFNSANSWLAVASN